MAKEKKPKKVEAELEKHDLKIELSERFLYIDKVPAGLRFYVKIKDDTLPFYESVFDVSKKDAERMMEVLL
jgi:hypothetical protein